MQNNDNNNSISLQDICRVLWKNKILIGIITVAITILGLVYTIALTKPQYKSSSSIIVAVQNTTVSTDIDYAQSQKAVITVVDAIKENKILADVADDYDDLTPASLAKKVSVSNSSSSMKITITVTDGSPERAQKLADAIAKRCIEEAVETKENGEQGVFFFAKNSIVITSDATLGVYASPNKKLYVLVSIVLGLVVSFVVVFIKDFMSTKYKTKAEIESQYKEKIIGLFPDDKKKNPTKNEVKGVELIQPSVRAFEPYNKLLSNIKYSNLENPCKSIVFTSTLTNELKSTTAANLAYCIKNNNQKVIIVDLDLRNSVLHKTFGVAKENGIVDYVAGNITKEELIKASESGVDVITTGKDVLNPVAVLETTKLKELIAELKNNYDYVIIDTAPSLACPDAQILSSMVDGVIYNISLNQAKKKDILDSVKNLKNVGANIIGISVTKADAKDNSYYYYYTEK